MGEKDERCERCRFWEDAADYPYSTADGRTSTHKLAWCKRMPPSIRSDMRGYGIYSDRQPLTEHDDWCGEFVAREGGDE